MPVDIIGLIATTAGPSAAAFLAGWLGVRFSTEKQRRQRVADRQAEWYEEVTQALRSQASVHEAMRRLDAAHRKLGFEEVDRMLDKTSDYRTGIGSTLVNHRLYGSVRSSKAIEEVLEVVGHIIFLGSAHNFPTPEAELGIDDVHMMIASLYRGLAAELEDEYRAHMGLDSLERSEALSEVLPKLREELESGYDRERHRWAHYTKEAALAVEISDDGGATWRETHVGEPISIRVKQLNAEVASGWRTVHDGFSLGTMEDFERVLDLWASEPDTQPQSQDMTG